ncbi:hypothetical protein B0F90DRAFT_1669084 [Multifurca ochricompacta]|uniref:EF-hand domain-containing protein n=1 Tax=Multifurca ochricompacta TaxID=376703 RepID=A0AAD4QMB0_9AGAM|nr:hypothetical protein B0F90DRAFT_1669084 [Multifurca ochricompacta]
MPFTRLLRKFSQPSLARPGPADGERNTSSNNKPSRRRQATEPIPTLPRSWRKRTPSTVDRASSSPSTPTLSETPKVESPPEVDVREKPTPMPLPADPTVFMTTLAVVPHPAMLPTVSPVLDTLTETWNMVKDGPKESDLSRGLNDIYDTVTAAQGNVSLFTPFITAAVGAAEQSDIGIAVKEGIDHFFEGMPILMNALDVVADLHPFIGVVVMAFKTVYTLELKRRDNERKIIALYVEMKDMMGVLLLLKDVQNDKLTAPDGRTIEDRLKSLVGCTADDIKLCSNVCDAYAKKKLLAKVFLGPLWDAKLLSYVTLFSKRRQEFEFELSIHTSQGVDKANAKLDTIGDTTKALDEKMNVMMAMFQQLASPEQKQLSELVAKKGGPKALRGNDKILLYLEEAASKAPGASSTEGHHVTRAKPSDANPNADDLRNEIFEDPDVSVEKNQTVFFRKFEIQKRQIIDELTLVVKRESDRVIQEVKGGPHERILDRSIHEIWTEMVGTTLPSFHCGWRGNVKARHFVLALRDYYLEKLASETQGVRGISTAMSGSQNPDAWAIKFIDVTRLQPILEAFDDDASGFITISEMNRFTSSRPVEWSLAHWVSFWAVGAPDFLVGYRASIIDYADKIEKLFAKMEGVRAEVLPPNRQAFDDYLSSVWMPVHTLTATVTSLQPGPGNQEKFKAYLEAEESRLSANLKAVDYVIDGTDTLTLITGVGRIEKRHYEIMRIMRTKVLDSRELWGNVESILYVNDALKYRMNDLTNIFSQQKLDPEKQLQNFAYGIFKYFSRPKDLWSLDYIRGLDPSVISYNDLNEDQDVKLEDILKYGYTDDLTLDDWVYDGHSIDDLPDFGDVEPPLKDILGRWHGYFYEVKGIRKTSGTDTMMTFVLERADGEHQFKAKAWSNRGRFTITGSWSKDENDVTQIKFKMTFQSALWSAVFFDGHFDPERDALTGVWGTSADPESSDGLMEFRRIPPRYLVVYPSINEVSSNKPRALWRFAIAAVRSDVRRERWSWSYFAQRRDDRETVISLSVRYLYFGTPPNSEDIQRLCAAAQRLTSADACFYGSKITYIRAYTWMHENACCDWCGGLIGGARLFCLDCVNKNTETYDTLDLCCAPQCINARITYREDLEAPHEPTHRLLKVRTVILIRQHGRAYTAANAAFNRVERLCAKIAESSQQLQENEGKTLLDAKDELSSEPTLTKIEPSTSLTSSLTRSETIKPSLSSPLVSTSQGPMDETPQDVSQPPEPSPRAEDSDLPSCGKCKGRLSFPCWYCIACEDNLFICDACDTEGVPDLMRSSGKHTEDHHLIRCQAPEKSDEVASSTDQRLMLLEDRLNTMQTRFDDLTGRIGNIEHLLQKLAGTTGG